jgi:protein SCO1/2
MTDTLEALGPDGERIQPLFISVDPDRDTPKELAEFMPLFHPRLIGLTGTAQQVAATAKVFRAYYRKVAGSDPDHYTVDHSAYAYLVDGRGRVLKIFAHGTEAKEMAATIRDFLRRTAS